MIRHTQFGRRNDTPSLPQILTNCTHFILSPLHIRFHLVSCGLMPPQTCILSSPRSGRGGRAEGLEEASCNPTYQMMCADQAHRCDDSPVCGWSKVTHRSCRLLQRLLLVLCDVTQVSQKLVPAFCLSVCLFKHAWGREQWSSMRMNHCDAQARTQKVLLFGVTRQTSVERVRDVKGK